MKNIFLLTFVVYLALFYPIQAKTKNNTSQDGKVAITDFCPNSANPYLTFPSPEAASFLKYGEYPVSYSSGIPNISFPIYTIQTRELNFPISLSYFAGGIKVGEAASWVGLGWTLNTEGVVNCTIQGLPDDVIWSLPTSDVLRQSQDASYLCKIFVEQGTGGLSKIDRMRDRYDYSFSNSNGSFIMTDADRSVQFPYTMNKIIRLHSTKGVVCNGFIIITPNGTSYEFTEPEISSVQSVSKSQMTQITSALMDEYTYTSCWHLTKIVSCNKTDSIVFSYDYDNNLYYDYTLSQGCSITDPGGPAHPSPNFINYMTKKMFNKPQY